MVEKLTRDRAGMRQTVALFTTMRALYLPQPSVGLVPTREAHFLGLAAECLR